MGVILVLKPGRGLFQAAALVGLCAGLLAAIAQTGIRRMTSTEPTTRIIFYFSLFSTLVSSARGGDVGHRRTPRLGLLVAAGAAPPWPRSP